MTQSATIKVSVVIPVYNVSEYLPRCLDSILAQSLKEVEIICVDDCSPDRSGSILDEYATRDSRVKVIHKNVNQGPMMARHDGYTSAKGEYVFFCDGDDFLPVDALQTLYLLAKETGAGITAGNVVIRGSGSKTALRRDASEIGDSWHSFIKFLLNDGTAGLWGMLFSRKLFTDTEYTAIPGMKQSEDRRLLTEILLKLKPSVATTTKTVYYYWINTGSITKARRTDESVRSQFDALFGCYRLIEDATSDFSDDNDRQMIRHLSRYIESGTKAQLLININPECRRLLRFKEMRRLTGLRFASHTFMCIRSGAYASMMTMLRNSIRRMQGKA